MYQVYKELYCMKYNHFLIYIFITNIFYFKIRLFMQFAIKYAEQVYFKIFNTVFFS